MTKHNCPNCGAPRTGSKCEYCGTVFFDFTEINLGKRINIQIEDRRYGTFTVTEFTVRRPTLGLHTDHDGRRFASTQTPPRRITLELVEVQDHE